MEIFHRGHWGLCDSSGKERILLKDTCPRGKGGLWRGMWGGRQRVKKTEGIGKWLLFQEMALISLLWSSEHGQWPLTGLGLHWPSVFSRHRNGPILLKETYKVELTCEAMPAKTSGSPPVLCHIGRGVRPLCLPDAYHLLCPGSCCSPQFKHGTGGWSYIESECAGVWGEERREIIHICDAFNFIETIS